MQSARHHEGDRVKKSTCALTVANAGFLRVGMWRDPLSERYVP
jgi:hypothetical protein